MAKSRMQTLILEVLNAQPSLRDSKGYLKTFGPRTPTKPSNSSAHSKIAVQIPQRLRRLPRSATSTVTRKSEIPAEEVDTGTTMAGRTIPKDLSLSSFPRTPGQPELGHPQSPDSDDLHGESHSHPDSQIASTSNTMLREYPRPAERTDPRRQRAQSEGIGGAGQVETSSSTSLPPSESGADEVETPTSQQHTALVKVQGPFTRRQLESIADGMIYLKKLGLVSIIVVDGEEWSLSGYASEFSAEGVRIEEAQEEREDKELAPWISTGYAEERRQRRREMSKMHRATLRRTMLNDVSVLAEMLQSRGAPARPFLTPLVRVDAEAAQEAERLAPRHFPGSQEGGRPSSSTTSSAAALLEKEAGTYASPVTGTPSQQHHHLPHVRAFGYRQMQASLSRSPLVSDDGLSSLYSALATDHIPVVAPLAFYSDPEQDGAETSTPVKADDVLVALARDMAMAGTAMEEEGMDSQERHSHDVVGAKEPASHTHVDMMPLRLMVINREGGIPSHARGGNPHLAINLASEYSHILNSFVWTNSHPTALNNLRMVHDCLSYMPHTSSGIVVSHRSPRSLIANLITNKAAHSPSLPPSLLKSSRRDLRHTPTIIRPGLAINVIYDFDQVDQTKLTALLEASFKRKLDAEAYYARLRDKCDFVIITGDYQGAAIVSRETSPDDGPTQEPVAYLDKFAVLPSLQGSGTVDFLWGALRDEVQGLGLLDALNDNGGKGGFGKGRDLVWKSRGDNPVNRWYYERSNGFVKIDLNPPIGSAARAERSQEELRKGSNWAMFWCDAEERLSSMSGERRLSTSATEEEMRSVLLDEVAQASTVGNAYGGRRFSDYEEDQWGRREERPTTSRPVGSVLNGGSSAAATAAYAAGAGASSPRGGSTLPSSPLSAGTPRRLEDLDPRPGGGGQRLLPLIAPEEQGRLQRWAKCMTSIPSAWK